MESPWRQSALVLRPVGLISRFLPGRTIQKFHPRTPCTLTCAHISSPSVSLKHVSRYKPYALDTAHSHTLLLLGGTTWCCLCLPILPCPPLLTSFSSGRLCISSAVAECNFEGGYSGDCRTRRRCRSARPVPWARPPSSSSFRAPCPLDTATRV